MKQNVAQTQEDERLTNKIVEGQFIEQDDNGYHFKVSNPREGARVHVDLDEFDGKSPFKEGDTQRLLVEEDNGQDLEGSVRKARKLDLWGWLDEMVDADRDVEGRIIAKNKGGISVNIGIRAFCPRSHVDLHEVDDLSQFVGDKDKFQVIQFDKERCNIVVSRRRHLEKSREEKREETLKELEEGKRFEGVVRSLKNYGAFVDIGGIDGLLHISNLSWEHLDHPGEVLDVGDEIEVKVLEFDEDEERLSLGRKQLLENPWERVKDQLEEGDEVTGDVVSLTNFGAFIEIMPGVEGLAHITELSWNKGLNHPRQILEVGQEVQAQVLEIDSDEKRVGLSLKRLTPNPWEQLDEKYSEGDVTTGTIQNIADFGLFVEIMPKVEGLVHVSDVSWTDDINDLTDYYESGDEIDVKILDINVEKQRVALGVKQLTENPWDKAERIAKPGEKIEVEITKLTDFGAFAEVVEGIEGLIHISELDTGRIDRVQDVVKPGDELDVVVTNFDRDEGRIGLSRKQELIGGQLGDTGDYEEEDASATLGDMFPDDLDPKN